MGRVSLVGFNMWTFQGALKPNQFSASLGIIVQSFLRPCTELISGGSRVGKFFRRKWSMECQICVSQDTGVVSFLPAVFSS